MAVIRDTPYSAFNFVVELNDGSDAATAVGGFTDVSGLGTEVTLMDYRQGNDKENRVRSPRPAQGGRRDVESRRPGTTNFWQWILDTRRSPKTSASAPHAPPNRAPP